MQSARCVAQQPMLLLLQKTENFRQQTHEKVRKLVSRWTHREICEKHTKVASSLALKRQLKREQSLTAESRKTTQIRFPKNWAESAEQCQTSLLKSLPNLTMLFIRSPANKLTSSRPIIKLANAYFSANTSIWFCWWSWYLLRFSLRYSVRCSFCVFCREFVSQYRLSRMHKSYCWHERLVCKLICFRFCAAIRSHFECKVQLSVADWSHSKLIWSRARSSKSTGAHSEFAFSH